MLIYRYKYERHLYTFFNKIYHIRLSRRISWRNWAHLFRRRQFRKCIPAQTFRRVWLKKVLNWMSEILFFGQYSDLDILGIRWKCRQTTFDFSFRNTRTEPFRVYMFRRIRWTFSIGWFLQNTEFAKSSFPKPKQSATNRKRQWIPEIPILRPRVNETLSQQNLLYTSYRIDKMNTCLIMLIR